MLFLFIGVVLFGEFEVEAFFDEVGFCHFDGEFVAQLVASACVSANDAEVFLVELVVVSTERAHRYHTFALVLVEFDVYAPFGNARYHAVEHHTEAFAHKLHLLVFYRGAFGVGGELLHIGRVFAILLVLFFVDRASAVEVAASRR